MQSCYEKNRERGRNAVTPLSPSTRARSLNSTYSSGPLWLKESSGNSKGTSEGDASGENCSAASSPAMVNGVRLFSPQRRRLKGDVKRVDAIVCTLESEQGMSSALPPVAQKHQTGLSGNGFGGEGGRPVSTQHVTSQLPAGDVEAGKV